MPLVQFDRSTHSVDGMPICAMCGASFTRWEVLEAHVTHQRCTGAVPTQAMDPQAQQASTPTKPIDSTPKGCLQKTSPEPEPEQTPPPTAHNSCATAAEEAEIAAAPAPPPSAMKLPQQPEPSQAMPPATGHHASQMDQLPAVPAEPSAFRNFAIATIRNKGLAARCAPRSCLSWLATASCAASGLQLHAPSRFTTNMLTPNCLLSKLRPRR